MYNYEVNIAVEYKPGLYTHWAKVKLVAQTEAHAIEQARILAERFPSTDWKVELTKWSCPIGQPIALG